MSAEPTQAAGPENPKRTDPSQRAFVTTTGFVFQVVALVYIAVGGGYWFISGRVQENATVRVDRLADYAAPSNVPLAITTVNVLAAVAGGMGLLAIGVGLQGEQRRSGTLAMVASAMLAVIALVSAVLYIVVSFAWIRAAVVLLFGLCNVILFLLAGHSASLLKRFPPPPDQGVVDEAWLEAHAQSRRRH